jgi:hypothetical protein
MRRLAAVVVVIAAWTAMLPAPSEASSEQERPPVERLRVHRQLSFLERVYASVQSLFVSRREPQVIHRQEAVTSGTQFAASHRSAFQLAGRPAWEAAYRVNLPAHLTFMATECDISAARYCPPPPESPWPPSGADVPSQDLELSWTVNVTYPVVYDLYFDTENPPRQRIVAGLTLPAYSINARPDGSYFWRVVVIDPTDPTCPSNSPVWRFNVVSALPTWTPSAATPTSTPTPRPTATPWDCSLYDVYEMGSGDDTPQTARLLIPNGAVYKHWLCDPQDEDWHYVSLQGNLEYYAWTSRSGPDADPWLFLYDAPDVTVPPVVSNDNCRPSGKDACIRYRPAATGTFYLRILGGTRGYGPDAYYDLQMVQVVTPTATPRPTATPTRTPVPAKPLVLVGGYMNTRLEGAAGGNLTILAIASSPDGRNINEMQVYFQSRPTGFFVNKTSQDGDYHVFQVTLPVAGPLGRQQLALELQARDMDFLASALWPFLAVR